MKYDVFISYSRKDYVDEQKNVIPGNSVSKIIKALDNAGITYWIDKKGIYCGDEFSGIIADAIDASKAFVFVSSESSNNATWTIGEVATAQEGKKKIIPVRIDSSRYHKSLRVRLNALDYIDFTSNPEKGAEDLVKAIKTYIEQLEAEERKKEEDIRRKRETELKKAEEEKKRREQEEQLRIEEQKRFFNDIKIDCNKLNIEETKLLKERDNLLLSTENISDTEKRAALKKEIIESSPFNQKLQEERLGLVKEIETLKDTVGTKEAEIQHISKEKAENEVKLEEYRKRYKKEEEAKRRAEDEIERISKEKAKNEASLNAYYQIKLKTAEEAKSKAEKEILRISNAEEEANCKAEKEAKLRTECLSKLAIAEKEIQQIRMALDKAKHRADDAEFHHLDCRKKFELEHAARKKVESEMASLKTEFEDSKKKLRNYKWFALVEFFALLLFVLVLIEGKQEKTESYIDSTYYESIDTSYADSTFYDSIYIY